MTPNPMLGVFLHWLGGLAPASFYVPYRGVKVWAWETYWLVGGLFSWIIAPWLLARADYHTTCLACFTRRLSAVSSGRISSACCGGSAASPSA